MRKLLPLTISTLLFLLGFFACKKEKSCEGCFNGNRPPIAIAGDNISITLPIDSVLLDGSASNDPDGNITEWHWTKISGPVSITIINNNVAKTIIKNLSEGIYQIELKVKDNHGLSTKDTVQVTVKNPGIVNRPPIANAGPDQIIILPVNSTNIDGSNSTDPDNNIVSFLWTKISGPASFNISNTSTAQTQLTNLSEGVYQLELKVTDAGGLFDTDTISINLTNNGCFSGTRPVINANLIPIGTLSQARSGAAVGFAGNKIVYAGGQFSGGESGAVDIYNLSSNQWSVSSLSVPRSAIAATSTGNKIFFAGGGYLYSDIFTPNIDVYDAINSSWSTLTLSSARTQVAVASVGDKVMFGGGWYFDGNTTDISSTIDIYNMTTNSWSLRNLTRGAAGNIAVASNDKIYFGLGSKVDIYDNATNVWSGWDNNQLPFQVTASSVGNKIYWSADCTAEIQDINTGLSTLASLTKQAYKSIVSNGKVLFFHYGSYQIKSFDIYDPSTNSWSIGMLNNGYFPQNAAIISVNNEVYIAGGTIDCIPFDINSCMPLHTDKVYKLQF